MESGPAAVSMGIVRCKAGERRIRHDMVAVEAPLEIRAGGDASNAPVGDASNAPVGDASNAPVGDASNAPVDERLVVVMRTPGEDLDLATGMLLTEGLLDCPAQIAAVERALDAEGAPLADTLTVLPAAGFHIAAPERRFPSMSACGLCGKSGIESVALAVRPISSSLAIEDRVLQALPGVLREAQEGFAATGALHAAGLFDARGRLVCLREDIGRHNAVDKVVGALAREGRFPLPNLVLVVSGRASFEVCQKAAMAGIPVVAAVSAPTSLAVELARSVNMTLVGFLRGETYNIYWGAARILA